LRNAANQTVEIVPVEGNKVLGEYGRPDILIYNQALTTTGLFAMSCNQRWLLLQHPYSPPWSPLRDWLQPRWQAAAQMLTTDSTYAVLLYDRGVKEVIQLHPSANHKLQFIFDLENRGFLVVDRSNIDGTPRFPAGAQSTLTWYSLPLRAPPWKWYLTLGVACLPLVLSWLRRKRDVRLPVAAVTSIVVPS
jgi:hypothetical protein